MCRFSAEVCLIRSVSQIASSSTRLMKSACESAALMPFYVLKRAFEWWNRNRLWFWAAASFSFRSDCGRMKFQFDLGAGGWLRLRAAFSCCSPLLAAGIQQPAPLCWSTMIRFRKLNAQTACGQSWTHTHTHTERNTFIFFNMLTKLQPQFAPAA